jgi:SAM-dependent methyltransferase
MFAAGERVVVPGCGSGHDVLALAQAGAVVTGLDYAPAAVEMTRDRLRQAGVPARIEQADVLDWVPDSGFDAVYEQTCWCALHPDHWDDYAAQLARWLRPQGRLFLMAMQCVRPGASQGRIEGPPYHMDVHGLRALLPSIRWDWPAPPYPVVPHPVGWSEIAVVLRRR